MSRLIRIIDTQEKSSKKIIIILFFTKRVRYTIIYLIESKNKKLNWSINYNKLNWENY